MQLYMIRHGIAADRAEYTNDDDRPLTKDGDRKTAKIAQRLKQMQIHFDLIVTSPLTRAEQTAQILQKARLAQQIEVSSHLAPDGELPHWLNALETWRDRGYTSVAIVGHQPNLGNWAERLLWGQATDSLVVKKAGIMGLTLPKLGSAIARCELFWLTPPKFIIDS